MNIRSHTVHAPFNILLAIKPTPLQHQT